MTERQPITASLADQQAARNAVRARLLDGMVVDERERARKKLRAMRKVGRQIRAVLQSGSGTEIADALALLAGVNIDRDDDD